MRVIGLLSGGKDSVYSLLQCVRHGHTIVALANLKPRVDDDDECESHMFQTIGHNVVRDLARCMDVPFFTTQLHGSSLTTSLQYQSTAGDEIEDMHALLAHIQATIPDVQAVSSGAILSSYQRLRVEEVASRLGLTSLAYLWQRDQSELLDDMIAHGMEAILVKVACMGLLPNKHLGRTLSELRPHLQHINRLYGVHVCGEGGEYESLTLDCPLYTSRMILDDTEKVGDLRTDIAPVAVFRINKWHLQSKEGHDAHKAIKELQWRVDEQLPSADDDDAASSSSAAPIVLAALTTRFAAIPADVAAPSFPAANRVGSCCFVATVGPEAESSVAAAVASPSVAAASSSASISPVAASLAHCVSHVKRTLHRQGFDMSTVMYVQLFLASMGDFEAANAHYKKLFSMIDAPSRACVQLPRAADEDPSTASLSHGGLSLDCVASRNKRHVLHVQSISEWAPACIGPYSQASKLSPFLWLAGQIGLDPAQMTLPASPALQSSLAFRHCSRVLRAEESSWCSVISCVVYWQQDFWRDQQTRIQRDILPRIRKRIQLEEEERTGDVGVVSHAPMTHIALPTLPRNALVEVQVIAASPVPRTVATLTHHTSVFRSTEDSAPAALACRVYSGYDKDRSASIWSAVVEDKDIAAAAAAASASASSSSSAAPAPTAASAPVSLQSTCALLARSLDAAIGLAGLVWADVLVFRVYVPAAVSVRDVRIALHAVLGPLLALVAPVPAVSFIRVAESAIDLTDTKMALKSPVIASTLLSAHLVLLREFSTSDDGFAYCRAQEEIAAANAKDPES